MLHRILSKSQFSTENYMQYIHNYAFGNLHIWMKNATIFMYNKSHGQQEPVT